MIPQIFNIGPLPVNSFGLMIALAILAGIYSLQKSFLLNGLNPKLAERYVFVAGIVGLIGARVWYLFEDYEFIKDDFWSAAFSSAGFTFYGGFIIASVALFIMSKIDQIPLSKLVDSLGPTLTLAYMIGRLGCQLSGDGDYGIATNSIFGMSFAQGIVPTAPGVLVFPTPLYESVLSGIALIFLLKIESRESWKCCAYSRFGAYLFLLGIERFLVEIIRVNPEVVGPFSQAQLIAMGLVFVGSILSIPRFFRQKQ